MVVVVSGKFEGPQRWLDMAAEARGIAETMSDPYSKRTLLLIAQQYEALAERARKRAETEKAAKSA